jgi:hypothetical protein
MTESFDKSSAGSQPLLSVCVPTYNRSHLLRLMLEALIPQAASLPGRVEVCVVDNASTDDTAQVVGEVSSRFGAVNFRRREDHVSVIENMVTVSTQQATGEYVWLLSDHNLLRPGALARIVDVLQSRPQLDVLYVNFRHANFPEHWPDAVDGGFEGAFAGLGNPSTEDTDVAEWHELIHSGNSAGTQSYVHVIRRSVIASYWARHSFRPTWSDGRHTYPHAFTVAESLFRSPAFYIGDPAVTVFNGTQHWSDPDSLLQIFLVGYRDLMTTYARLGMDRERLTGMQSFQEHQIRKLCRHLYSTAQMTPRRKRLIRRGLLHSPRMLPVAFSESVAASPSLPARALRATSQFLHRLGQYVFHQCRPARWLRSLRDRAL